MGHGRLGYLPQTYAWQDVISLIAGGGSPEAIADATMRAAGEGLRLAARDAGVKHIFHLLTQITLAGQSDGFALALGDIGIAIHGDPSLFELIGGFAEAVDGHLLRTRERTDFSEMAQMAAAESMASVIGTGAANLYGMTSVEVHDAVRDLSTKSGFSRLAHDFFTRLTQRFVTYHLSRELSAHVGPGLRFADVNAHSEFLRQLHVTCEETAVIVKHFAGDWYSKTNYETGITPTKARDFIYGAFAKIRSELKVRGGAHVAA